MRKVLFVFMLLGCLGVTLNSCKKHHYSEEPEKKDGVEEILIPPANEIWYESHSGKTIPLAQSSSLLESNTYSNGKGIYKFSKPLTDLGKMLDYSKQCMTTKENEDFKSLTLPKGIKSVGIYGISHLSHAAKLVVSLDMNNLGVDCFCRFGEKSNVDNHIYFLSETCPKVANTTFWNQHGTLFVHYPKDSDYSNVQTALQNWIIDGVKDWSYTMVPTEYRITYSE